jgi:hypothetical protein
MATLASQNVRAATGRTVTYSPASAGGDRAPVGSNVLLAVRNASAGTVTVTLDATGTVFNGAGVPDTAVSVPAASDVIVPLSEEYRSVSDGLAAISYSAVASVTVAVLAV